MSEIVASSEASAAGRSCVSCPCSTAHRSTFSSSDEMTSRSATPAATIASTV
jgi:hypothetical protein